MGSAEELPRQTVNQFPSNSWMPYSDQLYSTREGSSLVSATEHLYSEFAATGLIENVAYCRHCFTCEDIEYLRQDIRSLSYRDMARLLGSITLTIGSGSEVNHFLPRLLETLAHKGHYMDHVFPRVLQSGRDAGWSSAQLDAVVEFVRTLYRAARELSPEWRWVWVDLHDMAPELKKVLPEAACDIDLPLTGDDMTSDPEQ